MARSLSVVDVPVEAANRRQAAVHEAGHMVMWQAFGFECHGYIWSRGDDDWVGAVKPKDRYAWYDLGTVQARMVGVAGAIAQQTWSTRYPNDFCADDMSAGWEVLLSPDDWRAGPFIYGNSEQPDRLWYRAATLVAKRFDPARGGDLWPELYRCARELIVSARTPSAAAKEAKKIYDFRLEHDLARRQLQQYHDAMQLRSAKSINLSKIL